MFVFHFYMFLGSGNKIHDLIQSERQNQSYLLYFVVCGMCSSRTNFTDSIVCRMASRDTQQARQGKTMHDTRIQTCSNVDHAPEIIYIKINIEHHIEIKCFRVRFI